MVSGHLSGLLMDWTLAVTELNMLTAHKLLEKEPELLWTPIPHSLDDTDHLQDQLVQLECLGSSFQPVSAIQFTLLQYRDISYQDNTYKFLSYLIEQSSLHDLDTRFWGECNNSTIHLVCFLGFEIILKLLIEKGVSINPINDLGYLPKDVCNSEIIIQYLSNVPAKKKDITRTKSVRPNYSTPDRFKLLRELAEESSIVDKKSTTVQIDRNKSEGHYFRKGRVKETQQKVLIEEEINKKGSKRQLEVAQLVKKSAVKNNPLWKKMEKRSFTSPIPSPSNSTINTPESNSTEVKEEEPIEETPKRNSKVISSLKTKSCVSSSIFVQADEDIIIGTNPPVPIISLEPQSCVTEENLSGNETQGPTTIFSSEPSEINHVEENIIKLNQSSDEDDEDEEEDDDYFEASDSNSLKVAQSPNYEHDCVSSDHYSDDDDDEEDDDEITPVQFATRLVSPVYKSVVIINEENAMITNDKSQICYHDTKRKLSKDSNIQLETLNKELNEIVENKADLLFSTTPKLDENLFKSVEPTTPTSPPPVRPKRSDLRRNSSNSIHTPPVIVKETPQSDVTPISYKSPINNVSPNVEESPSVDQTKDRKRMSGTQKAAWTMSMSSWAAILDREFNLDELQKQQLLQSQAESKVESKAELPKASTPTVIIHTSEPSSPTPSIQRPRESINIMNNTKQLASSRYSTATIVDYESGKLQLSDQEMNEMMLHHGFSTTEIDNMESIRSNSSVLSLSFKDFEIPDILSTTTNTAAVTTTATLYPSKSSSQSSSFIKPPQIKELPRLDTSKNISRKPIAASLSEATITKKNINSQKKVNAAIPAINLEKKSSKHGKLYLHVNGIQDILLPLPKDRAYVRCVVSDGKFEYMSRYEILEQNINFDYECVIDTHPDMIITISLHVRPDYVMKSKAPFSRLFSSKKKKESLSGYVNKEDGAIGQARFALAHMLPACIETTYLAGFHCFNAWYSRSFKERHRQKKKDPDQDVLKVVGNFDVEMLYLPVTDFQKSFPRNLRECDFAIKQLHKSVEESSEKYHTF